MNKNRIEGRPRCDERAGCSEVAGSVAEVNAAVVPGSNASLPGEIPRRKCLGKSAEAIVASKAGKPAGAKGRTGQLAFDRGRDVGADNARMGEVSDECRSDGKHGVPSAGSSDSAGWLGLCPNLLTGTAGCGPACPVVWELGLAH